MTTRPQIEFTIKGLDALDDNLDEAPTLVRISLNDALRDLGKIIAPVLRRMTPRRTGKLANSTRFQIVGGTILQTLEVRQGAKTPGGAFYGQFVREGTQPHIIRVKNARALRFEMGGQIVFARSVKHPGTKPNPYHIRTLKAVQPDIDRSIRRAGERVSAFIAGREFEEFGA